jgi:hypothetical protein
LGCNLDSLSKSLLCLTFRRLLANLKDYSRHLTRFSFGNLAVGPCVLQWRHAKIAWPMERRFSMLIEPFG